MNTDASLPVPSGEVWVDIRFDQESVWLTQRQMVEVFRISTDNVSLPLKNIYAMGELDKAATTEDFSVVRSETHERSREIHIRNPERMIKAVE